MSRKAFAFAVAIALHVGFAWVLFAPKPIAPLTRSGATQDAPRSAAARAEPRRDARAPRPRTRPAARYEPGEAASQFRTEAERLAYERGVSYELARRESFARLNDRAYGESIGALMRLPVRDAWPALEALAREGDDEAARALLQISVCAIDAPQRDERYRRLRASAVEGLSPADAAFVHGALDAELLSIEQDEAACRSAGLDKLSLVQLARDRLTALGRPKPPPEGRDVHAWIRYYGEAFPSSGEDTRGTWISDVAPEALRWLERFELGLTADEWRMLVESAPEDPTLVSHIAHCALRQCEALPAEAWDDALGFVERAAGFGSYPSVAAMIERHRAAGADTVAHAWAEFGMWVIEAGCHPMPSSLEYAQLARERAAVAARLTPEQFAEARRTFAAFIQAYGNNALAAQGCSP